MMRRIRRPGSTLSVTLPDRLSSAIARPRQHVEAVLAQSLAEAGTDGRAALAWNWVLTGTRPSPVTLSLPPGRPPTNEEIRAEADAEPEGSTAPPGVPSDYCDQLGEARRILAWLTGDSDDIPLDDEQRGRFIGARDDYARTDAEIRLVRAHAARSLAGFDLSRLIDRADAADPWRWEPRWMNAAWQRGVRDLLDWVLSDRPASPLSGCLVGLPTVRDLSAEEIAAEDVIAQGRTGGLPVNPRRFRLPSTARPSKRRSPGFAAKPPVSHQPLMAQGTTFNGGEPTVLMLPRLLRDIVQMGSNGIGAEPLDLGVELGGFG